MVKYGMNMLLWTSDVSDEHFPLFGQLKNMGYDSIELPVFDLDTDRFTRVGNELKKNELSVTSVTVCSEETNLHVPRLAKHNIPYGMVVLAS